MPQALLLIRVQPNADRTEVVGTHGDALKVRVAAPPVDGAANRELVRFLASQLATPRSAVTIERGAASRVKRVRIAGLTAPEAISRLMPPALPAAPSRES